MKPQSQSLSQDLEIWQTLITAHRWPWMTRLWETKSAFAPVHGTATRTVFPRSDTGSTSAWVSVLDSPLWPGFPFQTQYQKAVLSGKSLGLALSLIIIVENLHFFVCVFFWVFFPCPKWSLPVYKNLLLLIFMLGQEGISPSVRPFIMVFPVLCSLQLYISNTAISRL